MTSSSASRIFDAWNAVVVFHSRCENCSGNGSKGVVVKPTREWLHLQERHSSSFTGRSQRGKKKHREQSRRGRTWKLVAFFFFFCKEITFIATEIQSLFFSRYAHYYLCKSLFQLRIYANRSRPREDSKIGEKKLCFWSSYFVSPNFEGYETKNSALSFLASCSCVFTKSLEAKIDGALAKSHCLTNLLLVFVLQYM